MKVGFTGSRNGMTFKQREYITNWLMQHVNDIEEGHHGDCVGSDAQFDAVCKSLKIKRVAHPPIISAKRAFCKSEIILSEKDYLIRNNDIVLESDILLATPSDMENQHSVGSGTWYTIRRASSSGKDIIVVFPSGEIRRYITKNIKANYGL